MVQALIDLKFNKRKKSVNGVGRLFRNRRNSELREVLKIFMRWRSFCDFIVLLYFTLIPPSSFLENLPFVCR